MFFLKRDTGSKDSSGKSEWNGKGNPAPSKKRVRRTLVYGDLRLGFEKSFAEGNDKVKQNAMQRDGKASLVSGFDSSTENQTFFKPPRDKNYIAPFLVKNEFLCVGSKKFGF
jgi:hypothetical protein